MNAKEEIRQAKIAAHWIKDLGVTVTFVALSKKVHTRDGWYYRDTWNIVGSCGAWEPIDTHTLYAELGLTNWTDGSYALGEVLKRNGYPVKDDGWSVVVFGKDVADIMAKATVK